MTARIKEEVLEPHHFSQQGARMKVEILLVAHLQLAHAEIGVHDK